MFVYVSVPLFLVKLPQQIRCYFDANAVVNKNFHEPFSDIAGIPVKVVKKESVVWWQKNRMNLEF
ncbi:hypothetical protein K8354_09720 [Polaribacter litorisediminis]|uniref:hypothetical protein n=1 Tax=Polaribacter litorisediminis TaxID=1908341 RepID=UPI001CBC1C90|nr:hypothetical protein [Polaribacter litorisediminis]UAM96620.1 hypothetical protein K8354_09720 [Polaribacter litorisediminis]